MKYSALHSTLKDKQITKSCAFNFLYLNTGLSHASRLFISGCPFAFPRTPHVPTSLPFLPPYMVLPTFEAAINLIDDALPGYIAGLTLPTAFSGTIRTTSAVSLEITASFRNLLLPQKIREAIDDHCDIHIAEIPCSARLVWL